MDARRSRLIGGLTLAAILTMAGGVVAPTAAFAAPALRTWIGQGATDLWSDPDNWNVPPVAGDSLRFPDAPSTRRTSVNDLPSGLQIQEIEIEGGGYTLIGASLSGVARVALSDDASATIDLALDLHSTQRGDFSVGTRSMLAIGGAISGPDGFEKFGAGTLQLNHGNSFSGEVGIAEGTLTANAAGALGASGSTSDGTLVVSGATLSLTTQAGTGAEFVSLAGLGVNGVGALHARTGRTSVSTVTLRDDARIGVDAGAHFQTDWVDESRSGVFLTKTGSGTLELVEDATHSGSTIVRGGTLSLGRFATHQPPIRIDEPTAVLRSRGGTSGAVTAARGSVGAWDVDGVARPIRASAFTFTPASTLVIPFSGPTPATTTSSSGWGFLRSDRVDLGGAVLDLRLAPGFAPSPGATFAIVRSPAPILGTFAGLPEGGFITAGGTTFRISYTGVGGGANQVVLTALDTLNILFDVSARTALQGDDVLLVGYVSTPSSNPIPGTVTFRSGSTVLGTEPISAFRAELTVNTLPVGDNIVTATYNGSSEFAPREMTPITITVQGAPQFTGTAPPAQVAEGSTVSYTFTASGFPAPTFAVGQGALPLGLSLSPTGVLSGTATEHGVWTFEIEADNGVGTVQTVERTITVTAAPVFGTIRTPVDPRVGETLRLRFPVSGTPAPAFAVTAGALPPGTVLSNDGRLTGVPTAAGVYDFTLTATNGSGSVSAAHRLTVAGNVLLADPVTVLPRVGGIPIGGRASGVPGGAARLAETGADGGAVLTALASIGLLLAGGVVLLTSRRRVGRAIS